MLNPGKYCWELTWILFIRSDITIKFCWIWSANSWAGAGRRLFVCHLQVAAWTVLPWRSTSLWSARQFQQNWCSHFRQVIWLQPPLFSIGLVHLGQRLQFFLISLEDAASSAAFAARASAIRWRFSSHEISGCQTLSQLTQVRPLHSGQLIQCVYSVSTCCPNLQPSCQQNWNDCAFFFHCSRRKTSYLELINHTKLLLKIATYLFHISLSANL